MEGREAEYQSTGPDAQQQYQRYRPVETEEQLSTVTGRHLSSESPPGFPGGAIEETREPKFARDSAREDDYLKRIPQYDEDQADAGGSRKEIHPKIQCRIISWTKHQRQSSPGWKDWMIGCRV